VSERLTVQPLHENSKCIWAGVLHLILLSPTFLELAIESFVKHLIHFSIFQMLNRIIEMQVEQGKERVLTGEYLHACSLWTRKVSFSFPFPTMKVTI
jgi:hypothetical protein